MKSERRSPSQALALLALAILCAGKIAAAPWIHEDIGDVGATGASSEIAGTFTISASGSDIWNTADEFRFVHQSLNGDGEIVARVESIANTNAWAKAGVMIRSSTAANSAHVDVVVTPGQGVSIQWRPEDGAVSQFSKVAGITAPRWLKLVRRGHIFSGHYSNDGTAWIQIGNSVRVPITRTAEVGLAVTSHNDGVLTTAVIDSVTLTPGTFPRLLFIRGGSSTGGFLEGGADDQLADLGDFSTTGGNHGWGEFTEVLVGAGYSLDAAIEGPSGANTPVDLTNIGLDDYAVVIFGSNNADYTTAQVDALEAYVRAGGGALFISDANFGSSWNDAPDSDQEFLDRFGLVVNQDQGTYQLALSEGDFTAPAHPILNAVGRFDGEGVSPFVLGVLPTPDGATITRLARAENQTRNNDNHDPGTNQGKGSSRAVTASDASLVAVEIDHGRVVGHFDRNTFFNLNGAGTSIQRFDNTQFAINLMGWLSNQTDPITPYEGWAQSHFATLPGGRDDPQADFDADPNGDGLTNGVHYGFGGSPLDGDRRSLGLPIVSSGDIAFSMPEPPPADLVIRFESSPDLGPASWSTIASRPPGGTWTGPISVTVHAGVATISYTPTPGSREFFRVVLEI